MLGEKKLFPVKQMRWSLFHYIWASFYTVLERSPECVFSQNSMLLTSAGLRQAQRSAWVRLFIFKKEHFICRKSGHMELKRRLDGEAFESQS